MADQPRTVPLYVEDTARMNEPLTRKDWVRILRIGIEECDVAACFAEPGTPERSENARTKGVLTALLQAILVDAGARTALAGELASELSLCSLRELVVLRDALRRHREEATNGKQGP